MIASTPYPATPSARTGWILERRPSRGQLDPMVPYHFLSEPEGGPDGGLVDVATIFLTNRECPWRCVMCDLWRNTTPEPTPLGAIPAQIAYALQRLPPARHIKLYNSGSFFDPQAIPPADWSAIAGLLAGFERVIVECHPALLNNRCLGFLHLIGPASLEVAIGLETAHPATLERLNKRMSVQDYIQAAHFLATNGASLRTFLLVTPPFLNREEGLEWTKASIQFAFEHGSDVVSLIPTRTGNGAMEELLRQGEFVEPRLSDLEGLLAFGLAQKRGRVFADLWDLERFSSCSKCFQSRLERLARMNLTQRSILPIDCSTCGSHPDEG